MAKLRVWKRLIAFVLPCVLLAVAGTFAYRHLFPSREPAAPKATIRAALPRAEWKARTLDALLAMPPDRLATVDIAEMNLLCAVGLPGAEKLDVDHALATLDRWAARVASETDRHMYRVHDPKWAESYR